MADEREPHAKRRRLESVIPGLIKRAVEVGVEKAAEAPDTLKEMVGGMKLPKEIAHLVLAQMEETKNGLYRVVAKEIRDFLESTNLSGEMQKLLTTVQFEISTTIRFKPNDEGDAKKSVRPEVKSEMQVSSARPSAAKERTHGWGSSRRRGKE